MKALRVLFVIVACAAPLMFGSCSKTELPERQLVDLQPAIDVEPQSPEVAPPSIEQAASDAAVVASAGPESSVEASSVEASKVPEERKPVEERKSSAAARAKGEINFDDLKFDLAKDAPFESESLTREIRELDGTTVKLRGYILPSTLFSETNISQFVLVRDNQECCFGPGAALFDCVMVQMVPGKTTDFVTRPVTVEGKFVIDTESYRYPPGLSPTGATHMAVFRIEGEGVQ